MPTTGATTKNSSPNKSAKTNKAENATKAQSQVKSVSAKSVSNKKADSVIASGQASHKLNSNTKNQTVNAHGASAQKKSETQMTGAKDSKPSQDVANKKNSEKRPPSTAAKSKPISSEGTNSEGQTRTDIRNEAVKQHNKRKSRCRKKRKQES